MQENLRQQEEQSQASLSARLRRFVENSDLSFYQIASRLGTSGAILSMWIAETTRPRTATELDEIGKLLNADNSPPPCERTFYRVSCDRQRWP